MNEKHNIDRLFQEKFKDFEVAPPEFVWENIREELQEKKKGKANTPLWIRLSGIAALLVLGGLLATLFFNDAENPAVNAPAVVIDNNSTTTPADAIKASPESAPSQAGPSASGTSNQTGNNNTTAVASSEGATNNTINNTINNTTNTTNNAAGTQPGNNKKSNRNILPSSVNSDNAVAYEGNNTTHNNKNTATGNKKNRNSSKRNAAMQQGDAVAATQTGNKNNRNSSNTDSANLVSTQQRSQSENAGIVNNATTEGLAVNGSESSIKNTGSNNSQSGQDPAEQQNNIVKAAAANEGIAAANNTSGTNPANANNNPADKSNVIIDKNIPVTGEVALTAIDTTKAVPQNELEKLLQEKEKGKEEDKALAENKKSKERWNIRPQVAPVFYSSLSDGSPINEQFASNNKTYDNDLSYGLGINYALTDRISIRSGINTVNLNYATNDIAYYASLNSGTPNIGTSKAANIVIQNPGDATPEPFLINGQAAQLVEGSMVQKTGYIEIPLEMSYALVNKKFGIDVIGGVSSLFLNANNVSVVSSTGMSTQVGQAQNLNNLHFSTNVGVGFKYKFWDSFQASFEPTFKYQVNAYSRDAGNFKPYFIGLYSGVSFSF